jgi:hypothetical protein
MTPLPDYKTQQAARELEQYQARIQQNKHLSPHEKLRLIDGGPELWRSEGWTRRGLKRFGPELAEVRPVAPTKPPFVKPQPASDSLLRHPPKPRPVFPPEVLYQMALSRFQARYQGKVAADLQGTPHEFRANAFWEQCQSDVQNQYGEPQ